MRKVIAATFVSLDGVMQAPGGPDEDQTGSFKFGGWVAPYWDDAMGQALDEILGIPFNLLLGRKTYEIFAAHWPYIEGGDPIAEKFNAVTKYVATNSLPEPLAWKNSVVLRGNVVAEVAKLKLEKGPNLLLQGSSVLIQTLLANDLIDEFNLMVFPLLFGSGKRLFGEGTMPVAFKLAGSKTSGTGVTMNTYLRDGAVRTGSFAPAEPSDVEIARRKKMLQEG